MKKIMVFIVIFVFIFSCGAVYGAEDVSEKEKDNSNVKKETQSKKENSNNSSSKNEKAENKTDLSDTLINDYKVDWESLNEMQIALIMIDKQINYLMKQLQNSDSRVETAVKNYEERLQKQSERYEEDISELKNEISAKEEKIEKLRQENVNLHKKMALFNSKNGVYLKILAGFIVGLVVGIIVNAITSVLHRKKKTSSS